MKKTKVEVVEKPLAGRSIPAERVVVETSAPGRGHITHQPKVAEVVKITQDMQDEQNANDDDKAAGVTVVEEVRGPGAGTGPGGSAP